MTTTYKPTVHVSSSGAELQVQLSQRGNIVHLAKEPEGGYYLLVVEARPVSAAKTRVDLTVSQSDTCSWRTRSVTGRPALAPPVLQNSRVIDPWRWGQLPGRSNKLKLGMAWAGPFGVVKRTPLGRSSRDQGR